MIDSANYAELWKFSKMSTEREEESWEDLKPSNDSVLYYLWHVSIGLLLEMISKAIIIVTDFSLNLLPLIFIRLYTATGASYCYLVFFITLLSYYDIALVLNFF
jgi:hypothetical protein